MSPSAILFFIAAICALTGAVGVVALRNPFYSVLALVFHLASLAALFLLLRAEFVAAAQVIVYAGAVMVLYVFVVAYIGGGQEPLTAGGTPLKIVSPLFAIALAAELCIAMLGTALKGVSGKGAHYVLGFGTPGHIGRLFLTTYLFPFELASILLLVAAVGAVVLARRRRGLEPEIELERRVHIPRPAFTGTMAEAAGTRHAEPGLPELPTPGEAEREPLESGSGPPDRAPFQGGW
ncbi:MAG: NADH-quinone oxidoreductase subunit J [Solirubrobacterales bacterium]|nr:NADH-quinone oxidoreductase subunit J [Solirubrobacterales bacterium]MBV9165502.1 NADH-quinone oxidoreductase subunit J [Solirubrobacterales bacterium]MBV9534794.1 NADH-quinone oxidoreductase subunit J [Solirubrobacterales bacterium]